MTIGVRLVALVSTLLLAVNGERDTQSESLRKQPTLQTTTTLVSVPVTVLGRALPSCDDRECVRLPSLGEWR
jgi:hypothetical protein